MPSVANELDVEALQLARERGDALAVGHREQRTHLLGSSSAIGRALRSRRMDDGSGPLRAGTSGGEYSVGPWHTRLAHRQPGRPAATAPTTRPPRRPAHVRHWPWEYLFRPFDEVNFPDLYNLIAVGVARAADRDGDLLQHPHPAAPPAQRLRADVRVDPVDVRDHLQPDDRVLDLPVRLDHRPDDARDRARTSSSGSGSSASRRTSRRTSASWRSSATTRASGSPTRRPPSGPRASGAAAAERSRRPVPIEVRRFGVGHRRPDGPPGTTGIRARSSRAARTASSRSSRSRATRGSRPTPTRTGPGSS